MRKFSDEARKWLSEYHGSIDSTALLMAFDAGRLPRGHKEVLIGFAEELDQARAKLARIEALLVEPLPPNSFYINGMPDQYAALAEFYDEDFAKRLRAILRGDQ